MRFRTSVRNISTFTKLTAALSSLSKSTWLRLTPTEVRFVLHPNDQGTSVWATLGVPTLFEDYVITSANSNIINLEVPLQPFHRALRSCASATGAVLRLTKRKSDAIPVLCLTIFTSAPGSAGLVGGQTMVTQEIPVRVLSASTVEAINEPQAPEADVHIYLPPLAQVRGIAERFIRLAAFAGPDGAKLVLAGNLQGEFKMRIDGGETVKVETRWRELQNPMVVAEEGVEVEKREKRERSKFAEVRVDGREWTKVLKVGALAKRLVACLCDGLALVLYVFLTEDGDPDETVLTYYMGSYSP